MSTNRFRGDLPSSAQVSTFTPSGPIPGDVFKVTINGKIVSATATVVTVSTLVTALQAALAASTIAELLEATYADSVTCVTATAAAAGKPFTPSLSVVAANLAVPVFSAPSLTSGGSLSSGTPYFYVMTALNSNGETTQSAEVTATPSGGNLKVVLTWTAVPGATGYTIYRSTTTATYGGTSELTDIVSGATVTFTDDGVASLVAGTPPLSNTASSPATFTLATTTSNSSPNDWNVAANWSLGAVPINGDDVIIDGTSTPILNGLDQSAVTLASLTITASYTGQIGNPDYNPSGYAEYRGKYLQIGATTATIGFGAGGQSGRTRIDFGSVQVALTVYGTGTPIDQGLPALQVKGTHVSNAALIYGGSVGFACQAGESTTFLTAKVMRDQASLYGGTALTLGTLTQRGGSVTLNNTCTTITKTGGTLFVLGSGTVTTFTHDAGKCSYQSSGTCTTYTGGSFAAIDFSADLRTKTVTTATFYGGTVWNDPNASVTITNGIVYTRCRLGDVKADFGVGRTITVT